jgi:hypothetical protein
MSFSISPAAAAAGSGKCGKCAVKESEMDAESSVISHREITDPADMRRLILCCNNGLLKEMRSQLSTDFSESPTLETEHLGMA